MVVLDRIADPKKGVEMWAHNNRGYTAEEEIRKDLQDELVPKEGARTPGDRTPSLYQEHQTPSEWCAVELETMKEQSSPELPEKPYSIFSPEREWERETTNAAQNGVVNHTRQLEANASVPQLEVLPLPWRQQSPIMSISPLILARSLAPFLTYRDLKILSQTSKAFRAIVEPMPLSLQAIADEVPLGTPLLVQTLLTGRLHAHLRCRFLLQHAMGLPLFRAIREELTMRFEACMSMKSNSHDPPRVILFKPPETHFNSRRTPDGFSGHCSFAEALSAALEREKATAERSLREREERYSELSLSDIAALQRLIQMNQSLTGPSHHTPVGDSLFEYLTDNECCWLKESLEDEIRQDVTRTLPRHPLFRLHDGGDLVRSAMHQILRAVAVLEPGIGYCQGMNYIVGALLVQTLCPATTFWTLIVLIRVKSFAGLYSPGLPSLKTRLLQLQSAVAVFLPDVLDKIKSVGLDISLFAHPWIVTGFANILSPEALGPFWDAFLVGGWPVFMAMALALFEESYICLIDAKDSETAIAVFQNRREVLNSLYANSPVLQNIVKRTLFYLPKVSHRVLSNLSIDSLIAELAVCIQKTELPGTALAERSRKGHDEPPKSARRPSLSAAMKRWREPSQGHNDLHPETPKEDGWSQQGVVPPYLYVPRFDGLLERDANLNDTALRGVIVNFIASPAQEALTRGSQPRQLADFPKSDDSNLSCRRVSWSVIADSKNSPKADPNEVALDGDMTSRSKHTTTPGFLTTQMEAGGVSDPGEVSMPDAPSGQRLRSRRRICLPASGFFVIVDTRYHFFDGEEDPLSEFLFNSNLPPPNIEQIISYCSLPFFLHCAEKEKAAEATISRNAHSRSFPIDESGIGLQRQANQLAMWLRANGDNQSWLVSCQRQFSRGGFLVIPLKALINAKAGLSLKTSQLSADRRAFEEKLTCAAKEIAQMEKLLAKLKRKQRHLVEGSPQTSKSPRRDSPGVPSIWRKVFSGKVKRQPREEESEDEEESDATACDCLPSSTETMEAPGEGPRMFRLETAEEQAVKVVTPKHAKTLENLQKKIATTEEALQDLTYARSTYSASYHQMTSLHSVEEAKIVCSLLRSQCVWSVGNLPLLLLKVAGKLPEYVARDLGAIHTLYSELLSLPPLPPQFRALFGSG